MIADVTAKGLEAQLKAELRANELGYIVSKPTTECCRYDMIIDNGKELKRIQIKYCDRKANGASGVVQLNLKKRSLNGVERPCYTKDDIDGLIVYVKPIDKICYFPIEIISGKKSLSLRYEESKNNQIINTWNCFDYIW